MKIDKIVITSGPTREWLDPVRFLSNASTGRMGFELAISFRKLCEKVTYIHGPVSKHCADPFGCESISVESTDEMLNAVLNNLGENTLLVMAAAPADYRPSTMQGTKIKKDGSGKLVLELLENPDILKKASEKKKDFKNLILVGFAAETDSLRENALKKLKEKNLDFIAANPVGRADLPGFGNVKTEVTVYSNSGSEKKFGPLEKWEIAPLLASYLWHTGKE